jgi:hypothetical protein
MIEVGSDDRVIFTKVLDKEESLATVTRRVATAAVRIQLVVVEGTGR